MSHGLEHGAIGEAFSVSDRSLPRLASTTAELLANFPRVFAQDPVRIRDIFAVLGDRGLASALLVVALPQMLPLPLGVSNLLAVPIVIVAIQIAMRRHTLWLPSWFLARPIPRDRLIRVSERLVPWLQRLEMVVRPRLVMVLSPAGTHLVGLACAVVAAVAMTPLPLTGWLPGISLIIIALGMMERDGLVVLAGLGVGTVAVAVCVLVIAGLTQIGDAMSEAAASSAILLPAASTAARISRRPSEPSSA